MADSHTTHKPGSIKSASDVARTIIGQFASGRKDRIVRVYAADIHAATKTIQEAQDNAYRVGWSKGCDDTLEVKEFAETEDGKLFLGTSEQCAKPTHERLIEFIDLMEQFINQIDDDVLREKLDAAHSRFTRVTADAD